MKPKYAGSSYAVILMQLKHQNRQTHHLAGQDLECRTHLAIAGLLSNYGILETVGLAAVLICN